MTDNISRFYSWVAGAMGGRFLAQGNNSSRMLQQGIAPGTLRLPGRCPGNLLLPTWLWVVRTVNLYDQSAVTLHSNRPFLLVFSNLLCYKNTSTSLFKHMWHKAQPINWLANSYNLTFHSLTSKTTPTKWFCIGSIHCESYYKHVQMIETKVVASF